MQIVLRHNKVIDYSEKGYILMGTTVICESKGINYDNATIAIVDAVPKDIDEYDYFYIEGKFVKEDIKSSNIHHDHDDVYCRKEDKKLVGTELEIVNDGDLESVLKINGNSEQDSRSGKNLFDMVSGISSSNLTKIINGSSMTISTSLETGGHSAYAYEFPVKPSTKYYLSSKSTRTGNGGGGIVVEAKNSTGGRITYLVDKKNVLNVNQAFTTTADTVTIKVYLYACGDTGTETTKASATYTDVQLEEGTVATDYEPYGVQPSPDYPSEIRSVSGDVEVRAEGKNLFDQDLVKTEGITERLETGFRMTKGLNDSGRMGTKYYISLKAGRYKLVGNVNTNVENQGDVSFQVNKADGSVSYLQADSMRTGGLAFTSSKDIVCIQPYFQATADNGKYWEVTDFMILKADETDTTYVKGGIKTISLPLGDIELRSTPDTRDKFERVDGVWNKVSNIGIIECKSTFTYDNQSGKYDTETRIMFSLNAGNRGVDRKLNTRSLCNYFTETIHLNSKATVQNASVDVTAFNFHPQAGYENHLYFKLEKSLLDTQDVAGFQKWLSENPTEVTYVLATPTYTPITDTALITALDELEQLVLHKGYNHITAISINGVKAYLDLQVSSMISTVNVVETESSMDMSVLLAAETGDVKPKIPAKNKMTFNPTTGEAKINEEKVATIQNLSATIPTSGWSGSKPYYIDIPVQGLKATDKPHYGLSYSTVGVTAADKTKRENEQIAFNEITTMVANDNSLRVICDNRIPSTQITIQLGVVR